MFVLMSLMRFIFLLLAPSSSVTYVLMEAASGRGSVFMVR